MVTLPDAASLGARRIPQSQRNIVSFDSGAGQGLMQAGKQMQQIGAELSAEAEKKKAANDKLEAANAMLQAMQNDAQFEDDFRANPSAYKTAPQEYQKKRTELNARLLSGITDESQRAMVSVALQEQQLRTEGNIKGLSRAFETDAIKSYLIDSYASSKQSIKTIEDMQRFMTVRKAQYDGYAESGIIPADEATRLFQAERRDAQSTVLNGRIAAGDYRGVWNDLKAAPLNIRNNNPGNIRGVDGEFRKFATPEEGMAEMERDLEVKVLGKSSAMKAIFGANYVPSIRNIISTWAPKSENDTNAYIATVAKDTGLDPDAPLSKNDIKKIMPSMIKVEGGSASMGYFTQIDPDIRDTTLRQIKPIIQSDIRQKWENTVAAAENGLAVDRISESDLLMLEDPNAVSNYNNAMDVAEKSYSFMNMSQADINKELVQSKPVDTTAPNYAVQSKQYNAMAEAAARAVKAQIDAPIETAMKVDPAIRALGEQAAADPTKFPAYFSALDEKYKQWGVNPKYKYINKAQTEAIAADIEDAVAKGGDNASAKIASLYQTWGADRFGIIIANMSPNLSSAAMVAASNYDASDQTISRDILSLAAIKTEELASALPATDAKTIRDGITANLAPLQQTLLNTNPGSGATTFSAIKEQATRLAYSYAARGMNANDASEMAVKKLANDKYTYTDSYRIPAKYADRIPDIETGGRAFVNSLSPDTLRIPRSYAKIPEQYVSAVKSSAKWINNADESGLILVDSYGIPVFDKSGVAISKNFEQLELGGINVKKSAKELSQELAQ